MPFENRHTGVNPALILPGDPRITQYNERCWVLANLAAGLPAHQRPTRMYLAALDFGMLVAELRAQHDVPWSASDPPEIIYGKNPEFRVVNAGTDDDTEVARLNRDTPGAMDFVDRARQFQPR